MSERWASVYRFIGVCETVRYYHMCIIHEYRQYNRYVHQRVEMCGYTTVMDAGRVLGYGVHFGFFLEFSANGNYLS